jgi:hypothetical protein
MRDGVGVDACNVRGTKPVRDRCVNLASSLSLLVSLLIVQNDSRRSVYLSMATPPAPAIPTMCCDRCVEGVQTAAAPARARPERRTRRRSRGTRAGGACAGPYTSNATACSHPAPRSCGCCRTLSLPRIPRVAARDRVSPTADRALRRGAAVPLRTHKSAGAEISTMKGKSRRCTYSDARLSTDTVAQLLAPTRAC